MFRTLISMFKPKRWLKDKVDEKNVDDDKKLERELEKDLDQIDSLKDISDKPHGPPEHKSLSKYSKSRTDNGTAMLDERADCLLYSTVIGNNNAKDDDEDDSISDNETTDIDFYVNEYTRNNRTSFSDCSYATVSRETANAGGPRFNTQISLISNDSGICMNDVQVKQTHTHSCDHQIRRKSQAVSIVSSTPVHDGVNEVVQNKKISIVISVEDEIIKSPQNIDANKNERGSIQPKSRLCGNSNSNDPTLILKRQEKIHLREMRSPSFQMLLQRRKSVKKEKEECGKLKLSLQFFNDGKQLRVIIIRANILHLHNCHMVAKISIIDDHASTTKSTKAKQVKEGEVHFLNEVYFNKTSGDFCDSRLKIQLYKTFTIIKRKTLYGQTSLQLDELDFNLDTSMCVSLFKSNGEDVLASVETDDIQISSEDRSILAETAVTLFDPEDFDSQLTPAMLRTTSFKMYRQRNLKARHRRTHTLPRLGV